MFFASKNMNTLKGIDISVTGSLTRNSLGAHLAKGLNTYAMSGGWSK
jgi:hypothetical protein